MSRGSTGRVNRLFEEYKWFILPHALLNTFTLAECKLDMLKYALPKNTPLILVLLRHYMSKSKSQCKYGNGKYSTESFRQQEIKVHFFLSFGATAPQWATASSFTRFSRSHTTTHHSR